MKFVLIFSVALLAIAADVSLDRVPPNAAAKKNPYACNDSAERAGAKLYRRYCADCHQHGRAPALSSARVRSAPDGALFWVITNGVLRRGMPSWSSLPPQQRWQIIAYLKSK